VTEPLPEYEARRAAWAAKLSLLQGELNRLGNLRLALAVLTGVMAWLAYGPVGVSEWWMSVPLLAIFALFVQHSRVTGRRSFAERGLRFYDRALDRIKNQWHGKGEAGERFRDANHVYAEDLDLFGKGSLFELLCTARTAAGEDTLADWLMHPGNEVEASARQDAVRELSARLDLREDVALLGEDIRSQVRAEIITHWGVRPAIPFPTFLRPLAFALAVSTLGVALMVVLERIPLWPLALIVGVNGMIVYATRPIVSEILSSVQSPAGHLTILALVIQRLEQEKFQSPLLQRWLEQFKVGGQRAALQIKRLERLIDWLGADPHPIIKIIQYSILWQLIVALGIELWRRESGLHLGEWIEAIARFEAISALAALAFERPTWTFPQLLPPAHATFKAIALRHPLMAQDRCIPNDVALTDAPRLLIVSGSNMSGKSTLLRTIGLNTVLAWAGAPVNATRMELSPLQTGASIRVTDSLQDNRSRFMAEITRLRQIVDLTRESTPVLFLLDELLSGTNSHDRRLGAASLVKGLLRGNTIGLLTTHDLALAEIANDLGPVAANVHFEDRITNGKMEFDYQLRPGVVTHSNALELMRAVGLDV
jgi:hypothetical protein